MPAPTPAELREMLREVKDPEIGLDIVTLGLVYDIAIKGASVHVAMTLTTPGCPLTGFFTRQVQRVLLAHDGVADAEVEFIMDPPWTPDMIEKEARLVVGF